METFGELIFSAGGAIIVLWFVCALTTAPDLFSRDPDRPWKRVSLGFRRRDQMMVGERYRIFLAIATRWRRILPVGVGLVAAGKGIERMWG